MTLIASFIFDKLISEHNFYHIVHVETLTQLLADLSNHYFAVKWFPVEENFDQW